MSLLDRSVLDLLTVDHPVAGVWVVVYNPPDQSAPGYAPGWTLTAWPPGSRRQVVSLAAHGAGVHAGPRVAKAVAVRVLAEHGVSVAGWCDSAPLDGERGGLTMFRARLDSAGDRSNPDALIGPGPTPRVPAPRTRLP